MKADSVSALVILGVLVLVHVSSDFTINILELLLPARAGLTAVLLMAVAYLFFKDYVFSALALTVLSIFLLKNLWRVYPYTDTHRFVGEVARDLARFDADNSIDLQFGNGTATHDDPNMYVEPRTRQPMLLFPPSEERLQEMCG
jgi:hypothetical protein